MSDLYLKQMEIGPMQNFQYLIGDAVSKEVALVDPAWEVETVLQAAEKEGLKIRAILITHIHFDHVNALDRALRATDAKVYIHKEEAKELGVPKSMSVISENGTQLKLGDVTIELIHTPGHTRGSQCFYVQDKLISGDTLFIGTCGRTDFPGGSPEEMYKSLHDRLGKLPDGTILYPGHHYASKPTSTLGDQRKENPFMVSRSLHEFLGLVGGRPNLTDPDPLDL